MSHPIAIPVRCLRPVVPAVALMLSALTTLLMVPRAVGSQELRPYKHHDLDIQFTAPAGWVNRPRPGDEGTSERIDPETGIHVLMWHTTTEQSAERYLDKMSHMMDVEAGPAQRSQTIDGREARVLDIAGTIDGSSARTLLAVIPSGKSRERPFENILYIVQIWCPLPDRARLAERMATLLDSVRIGDRLILHGHSHRLYPETSESPPDLPSPFVAPDGRTFVTIRTQEGRYALVDVTVENGAPNDYACGEWGKGRQLAVDADDFPSLGRTGLHAPVELDRTTTITGRAVADITADAKPDQASICGFVAEGESILSVLQGDNRLVSSLGLTHPQLARPLFEIFNLVLRDLELYRRGVLPVYHIAAVLYDGHEITIEASAAKGWQESIFDDEVRGYWSITIRRELTYPEHHYLQDRYGHLQPQQLEQLARLLTSIHLSEMLPFYIMRYGFYEGHTDYRADPVAIAMLFGLSEIEDIDAALDGNLSRALTEHYAEGDPEG